LKNTPSLATFRTRHDQGLLDNLDKRTRNDDLIFQILPRAPTITGLRKLFAFLAREFGTYKVAIRRVHIRFQHTVNRYNAAPMHDLAASGSNTWKQNEEAAPSAAGQPVQIVNGRWRKSDIH